MGYLNKDTITGGQMISASFLNPGKQTFRVSDIKISGYEEASMYSDFSLQFNILDDGGRTMSGRNIEFNYNDIWDWGANENMGAFTGGKWSNYGVEIVPGSEDDYELMAGQAVWIQIPLEDVKFGSAGEVIQAEIPFPMVAGGNGIGNPMATGVWVSDLTITGYEEESMYSDFSLQFNILDDGGRTLPGTNIEFTYNDVWDWSANENMGAFAGGTWSNYGVEITEHHNADDYMLAPGEGIWIQAPMENLILTFPQVVGEQAVK